MYKVGDLVRVKIMEGFFASAHYKKGEVFIVNKVSQYNEGQRLSKKDYGVYVMESEVEPVTHLTTKEFIKLVEDMGYPVENRDLAVYVERDYNIIVKIRKDSVNTLDTDWELAIPNELFKASMIYSNTPLELREEKEKLYTLELPNNKHRNRFYCHQVSSKNYSFGKLNPDVNRQPDHIKHFTQKEIDELPNQELIKTLIKKEVKE